MWGFPGWEQGELPMTNKQDNRQPVGWVAQALPFIAGARRLDVFDCLTHFTETEKKREKR
jgi:hypothetical protein